MHAKLVALVGAALLLQSGAAQPVATDASEGCICADIYSPVCAVGHRRPFGNECEANCAGISSESLRLCEAGDWGEVTPPGKMRRA